MDKSVKLSRLLTTSFHDACENINSLARCHTNYVHLRSHLVLILFHNVRYVRFWEEKIKQNVWSFLSSLVTLSHWNQNKTDLKNMLWVSLSIHMNWNERNVHNKFYYDSFEEEEITDVDLNHKKKSNRREKWKKKTEKTKRNRKEWAHTHM